MIEITINRKPLPWSAPNRHGKRYFDPKWEEKKICRMLIKSQWDCPIITTPVSLEFEFCFMPPKSTSKKKYKQMIEGLIPHQGHIDVSNLAKMYEDCLKGIVIEDDSQVVYIQASKRWSEEDRIIIRLKEI